MENIKNLKEQINNRQKVLQQGGVMAIIELMEDERDEYNPYNFFIPKKMTEEMIDYINKMYECIINMSKNSKEFVHLVEELTLEENKSSVIVNNAYLIDYSLDEVIGYLRGIIETIDNNEKMLLVCKYIELITCVQIIKHVRFFIYQNQKYLDGEIVEDFYDEMFNICETELEEYQCFIKYFHKFFKIEIQGWNVEQEDYTFKWFDTAVQLLSYRYTYFL